MTDYVQLQMLPINGKNCWYYVQIYIKVQNCISVLSINTRSLHFSATTNILRSMFLLHMYCMHFSLMVHSPLRGSRTHIERCWKYGNIFACTYTHYLIIHQLVGCPSYRSCNYNMVYVVSCVIAKSAKVRSGFNVPVSEFKYIKAIVLPWHSQWKIQILITLNFIESKEAFS